jgi:hypothetical protein
MDSLLTISNLTKSKTFWFNAASIVLEISGQLVVVLEPGQLLVAVNVINICLRVITTRALSEK